MTDQKYVHWCGAGVPSGMTEGEHIPHTNGFQTRSALPARISSSRRQQESRREEDGGETLPCT